MMKQRSSDPSRRGEAELSKPVADRIAAYALAAGGASLGILTGAQRAEAKIVYTKTNLQFLLHASLDINGDGVTDFYIDQVININTSPGTLFTLYASGAPGNEVRGYRYFVNVANASRLSKGARIGASGVFYSRGLMADDGPCCGTFGAWKNDGSGFLGLKFQIDGRTHFGWAQISIDAKYPYRGIVAGYAYNTVPNEPIRAGQTSEGDFIGEMPPRPATLGLLALGAPGLDIWRPRRQKLASR